MIKVHLFASVGDKNKIAFGGGETSAKRLVHVMTEMGYDVQVVSRTLPSFTSKNILSSIYKFWGYMIDPLRWAFHLLFKDRKDALAMTICYSGALFPFYFFIVKIAKRLGFKTIVYVKGAFTEERYESFPDYIKHSFSKGLSRANIALYEGLEGKSISDKVRPDINAVWLPNFIEDSFMPKFVAARNDMRINLVYFGRLDPGKNIIMIIDIFDILAKKYNHLYLTIVGSGEIGYTKTVLEKISSSSYKERIERIPRIEHDELKEFLPRQHFFIFPTESEGHSNSLTEAMAYGVVPIASRRGFNASIIGNDSVIVDEMSSEAFAKTLSEIIDSKAFGVISQKMHDRISSFFTQEVVEHIIKYNIDKLTKQ